MPQVLVQIRRIDLPAILGGQVLLRPEERAHRPFARIDRVTHGRFHFVFVGQQPVQPAARGVADPLPQAARLEVPQHDRLDVLRLNAGVQVGRSLQGHDLDQRRLVAHADAAHAFGAGRRPAVSQDAIQSIAHLAAALGDAAGAESDADFALEVSRHPPGAGRFGRRAVLVVQEVPDHIMDHAGRQSAIRQIVDLNHRGQRTAAQARNGLQGEHAPRIRILAVGQVQFLGDGVPHEFRAFDVASGADADLDQVAADGPVAKLRVETGHARDGRRGDFGQRETRRRASSGR